MHYNIDKAENVRRLFRMKNKIRVPITKEKIIEASWELLKNNDIEDFSMRKLADQLNIKASSIYWHFKSKQDIFQALANEVAREILLSVTQEGDWKNQLYNFAINIRNNLKLFPYSAQLLMKTLPSEPEYLSLINTLLKIIDQNDLNDNDKFSSIMCLLNYVIYFEVDQYERDKVNIAMKNETDTGAYELFVRSIQNLPSEDSNILQRMYNNTEFKESVSENMFEFGLNLILMGIEQINIKIIKLP